MPPAEPIIKETQDEKKGLFSFLTHTHLSFEGRKEYEEIKVFTRRHWWVLLGPVLAFVFFSILPIFIVMLGAKWILQYQLAAWFGLGWILYLMCLWFGLFYRLTMHSLDVWIVTSERVIDSMQLGLFRRKVSELHLESIQDISVNTNGIIQSYFNFGDLEVQTGATAQRFLFEQIPKPLEVKDKIMEAAKQYDIDRLKVIDQQKEL
ncbi:MAG: hypothetical protein RJB39_510 [Candidatus Parcubacteria bacterium]|jgi:hypothetical protein